MKLLIKMSFYTQSRVFTQNDVFTQSPQVKKTYLAKNQSPPDYGISLKTLFILPIALILLVIDWLRS